jgi:nicotinate-nucleotide adenylyltransferase
MGGDSLRDLPAWEQPEQLVENSDQIGVMRRPGDPIQVEQLQDQVPGLASRLTWVNAPLIDISGRTIRKRLREGAPVRYFLTEAVLRIIQDKNLYRG